MRVVGVYEAKTHLARLLDEVENGESITITRHGRPVAALVPPSQVPGTEVRRLIDDLVAFRATITLAPGPTIGDMVAEGRR